MAVMSLIATWALLPAFPVFAALTFCAGMYFAASRWDGRWLETMTSWALVVILLHVGWLLVSG